MKQIINNEEEAWVEHKAFHEKQHRLKKEEEHKAMFPNDHALTEEEKEEQKNDPQKVIQNVSTFEFDQEIQ